MPLPRDCKLIAWPESVWLSCEKNTWNFLGYKCLEKGRIILVYKKRRAEARGRIFIIAKGNCNENQSFSDDHRFTYGSICVVRLQKVEHAGRAGKREGSRYGPCRDGIEPTYWAAGPPVT